jgi:hypothetical protein
MKTSRYLLAALLGSGVLVPSPAAAQTRGGFEAGVEVFDYSYRERDDGETVVRDDGQFIGIALGYVETLGSGWFLRAEVSGAAGSVDYRSSGSILDEEAGEARLDDVSQGIGRFEVQVGRDFMLSKGASLTPFVGLASRNLNDRSGGEETESGLLGYDRKVSYFYVPAGLALRHSTGGRGAITISAQYNHLIGGSATSKFSEFDPELPDVKVDLNGGSGFSLSAIAEIPVGKKAIRVGPFLRRWSIKESKTFVITNPDDPTERLELAEPKNRTTEIGLRLSFAF